MQFVFGNVSKPNDQLKGMITAQNQEITTKQVELDAVIVS